MYAGETIRMDMKKKDIPWLICMLVFLGLFIMAFATVLESGIMFQTGQGTREGVSAFDENGIPYDRIDGNPLTFYLLFLSIIPLFAGMLIAKLQECECTVQVDHDIDDKGIKKYTTKVKNQKRKRR